ncbi:hypothetical protein ACVBGC_26320 [Burkholderia stagnalis]
MPIVGLLTTGLVHASYVQQCVLDGTVASTPHVVRRYDRQDREVETSTFQMTVRHATPDGRDDGGCERTFAGSTLSVSLNAGFAAVKALRNGDPVRLEYRHLDNSVGDSVRFELLPDKRLPTHAF